jgi:hypothetical protein
MDDRQKEKSTRATAFAAIIAAIALLFVVHVEINPGPSGTPGSTAKNSAPPPADSPSGGTVGSSR